MSRIGKKPITIPAGVDVKLNGSEVTVKGPKGELKNTFNFIKKNYRVVNIVSGSLLILVGGLMMTGLMNKMVVFLS